MLQRSMIRGLTSLAEEGFADLGPAPGAIPVLLLQTRTARSWADRSVGDDFSSPKQQLRELLSSWITRRALARLQLDYHVIQESRHIP